MAAKSGVKSASASVGGVRLTHPDRVMFPRQGATKRAVAEYYHAHAGRILLHLKNRPLSLVRCPAGRAGECFFQKHHTASTPKEIAEIAIEETGGKPSPYLLIDSAAGLVAAAQIGALELHVWGARADRLDRPERLVFDIDPDEGLGFAAVKAAAFEMRDRLAALGLDSFPLLTGGKGVHVTVPLARRAGWPEVKAFARGFAERLAAETPDRYVATASKAKRKGRIFIDWLRNERGATAVAPYSLRARENAPVAAPVSWRELSRIDSAARYRLDNIGARLSRLTADPWEEYAGARQSITRERLEAVGAAA